MRAAKLAEDFLIRAGFAGGGQRGARQLQVVVAVGRVEVGVFEERGDGQNDIGEIGGIGLDLFENDGEKIFAAQTAADGVLIGRNGGGVGVVNDEGFDRRIVERGQRLAELRPC